MNNCQKCGDCCKQLSFTLRHSNPDLKELMDAHYNQDMGDMTLSIVHRCEQLKEDNTCAIYEKRPKICRDYWCDKAKNG